VIHAQIPLGHDLFQLPQAERVSQVPTNALDNDFRFQVSSFEQRWPLPLHAETARAVFGPYAEMHPYMAWRTTRQAALFDQGGQPGQNLIDDEVGHALDKTGIPGLQIENPRLIAQNNALCLGSGTAERNSEAGMTREIAALRDRADKRRAQLVERLRGNDQNVTRAGLFAAFNGT
jgi:hypothetical protein